MCKALCKEETVATNLAIDPDLLNRAVEVGGARSKKEAVTVALEEYIATRQRRQLLDLFGTVDFIEGYDYKEERRREAAKTDSAI